MSDLTWAEVAAFFDPESNGVAPDGGIEDVRLAHWQALFDLVRARGWRHEYDQGGETPAPLPSAREVFGRAAGTALPHLRVWPVPEVLVVFRPWSATFVDFDVDLHELQGQERLDVLCEFLRTLGRHLARSVVMVFEGSDIPLVVFDVAADRVRAGRQSPWT